MSLSALPEWKLLLLERKRREEEKKERREREEEERLASMPAWKRGLIQRRRAKQDEERERERDREGGQLTSDVLGITEDIVTEQLDNKLTFHLQTDPGSIVQNQVSKETISPIRHNPFIRSENSWRRDNRKEVITDEENYNKKATNNMGRERNRETEKEGGRCQEREFWRGREKEMWVEKTGNKSEGRVSTGREQVKESKEVDGSMSLFPPVTGLCTINADNIIIIEKDKNDGERLEKQENTREKEVQEEEKRLRMDLREFLAGGGSVTEIRASEVLIIKPPITDGKKGEDVTVMQERGSSEKLIVGSERNRGRQSIWTKEINQVPACETLTSRTVIQRAERIPNNKNREAAECSGRVTQLLSKFGEHPKPPMRSKSTDCFNRPGKNRARYSTGDLFVQEKQSKEEEETRPTFRGVPKRSFSFSDCVVCHQENGECEEEQEFKVVERTYSDRRFKPHVMVTSTEQAESEPRVTIRWGRPKNEEQEVLHVKTHRERRVKKKRNDSVCGNMEEQMSSADRQEGFTVASIENPEGIMFACQIPFKEDRERSLERESKRVREGNESEIQRDKRKENEVEGVEWQTCKLTELQTEAKAKSKRKWNQEQVTVASEQFHGAFIPLADDSTNYNTTIDYSTDTQYQEVTTFSVDSSMLSSGYCGQKQLSAQAVLSLHTDDLLRKIGHIQMDRDLKRSRQNLSPGDTDIISSEINENLNTCRTQKEHQLYQNVSKQAPEESNFTSQATQQIQSKSCTQEEVTIPRTVFYGVDVSSERRLSHPAEDGQIAGGGGVERRGSWKAGRPLTRVESLKERIRQQEEERQRSREAEERERKKAEVMDCREEDRTEVEGTVREVTQNRQKENTLQTLRLFDVTQEVSVAKSSPQLPVPVSLLQSASKEREVREISRDVSERDIYPIETGRETAHHVECGTFGIWRRQKIDREDEREREEELLEKDYLPPSLSPSPPLSDLLDTMSRIYNLKTVGSRNAVCISERTTDIPTHSGKIQGQYNPIGHTPSLDILPETAKLWNHEMVKDGDTTETVDLTDVQMVQCHVERLQLKEKEAEYVSRNIGKAQSSVQSSLATEQEIRRPEGQKRPDILRETQKSQTPTSPRFPQAQQKIQKSHSKPQQLRSFTVNAQNTQSKENSLKPSGQGNGPLSSSISCTPSPSPSPPLFSIRSASGGPGKRGTTITITPRRPGGASPSGGTPSPSRAEPQGQAHKPTSSGTKEAGKKRYPTAEEIEVIGGYQNLERSCLVKSRGTPKAVKVCFDDTQLEKVCEYPSEDCVLASLPCSPHPGPEDRREEAEGQEEDDDEESGAFVSQSGMSVCTGRVRFLKVDESCKR